MRNITEVFYTLINHSSICRNIHKNIGTSYLLMTNLQTQKVHRNIYVERVQQVLLVQTCPTIRSSPPEPEVL